MALETLLEETPDLYSNRYCLKYIAGFYGSATTHGGKLITGRMRRP